MNDKLEFNILLDYLHSNLSTRQLCQKYKEIKDSTGFKSHTILKNYGLKVEQKGMLFLHSKSESRKLVKQIISQKSPLVLATLPVPNRLSKYLHVKVVSHSKDSIYHILNGELRNLIQSFFMGRKKEYGVCQHIRCNRTDLDAAHHHRGDRKTIFMRAASKHMRNKWGKFEFEVYPIISNFLNAHKNGAILFLCKRHHRIYDSTLDKNSFLSNIR